MSLDHLCLRQQDFVDLVLAGGCVYGNQPRQGKQLCRGAVVPGTPFCARHGFIVANETNEVQQGLNRRATRAVAAILQQRKAA